MRICFPIRDFKGVLRGLHGRSLSDDTQPKYRVYKYSNTSNPVVWYGESWVDFDRPVVVVESVFDLAAVYRGYRNVVCPLSASLNLEKINRMGDMWRGVLMMDGDQAGQDASIKISKTLFPKTKFEFAKLSPGTDPASMEFSELLKVLDKFVDLDPILT